MMLRSAPLKFLTLAVVALSGCSSFFGEDDKAPLEGERISVLELQQALEPDNEVLAQQGLITPDPWRNQFWPQAGGYPNHSMQNLALSEGVLERVWSTSIGEGSTKELPLTAQPIIVDGRIFALDTDFNLTAHDIQNGRSLWRTDISDPNEDDPVISGGLAYGGGVIFATSGYNEILAVNPKDGQIFWRKNTPSPARAAPTVLDGRVFVLTLDSRLLALDPSNGATLWEFEGISEMAGLVGAPSPAANRQIVVPAFNSGDIMALRVENGAVAWADNLSNVRKTGGLTSISDIRAMPVIDKGLVIAASFSGRLVAIDERTGGRVWQREIGSSNTPWVAGNHLFVLTTDSTLVALGRETGSIRWVTNLPKYEDEEARQDPVIWVGPVLAGGRLILAGTGGAIIEIDPETGKINRRWNAGDTITIPPVVADSTLYILTDDGTLSAYR